MPRVVDLNADLGEGVTDDASLIMVVTSANLACGFHAGDEATMGRVCDEAAIRGVAIGAQVSYADREGFGRQAMEVASAVLTGWIIEQVQLLQSIARGCGIEVDYVKPHGALYNRVVEDADQAEAVLAGCGDLPVLTLPIGEFRQRALASGRRVLTEGFPDRGYTPEGRLVSRALPAALVSDPDQIARNAIGLADRGIESVCVHGDSLGAVQAAQRVRQGLIAAGYQVRSPWTRG